MRQARRGTALWGIVVCSLALLWACETTRNPGGIQRDLTEPGITLTNTVGDPQDISGGLRFNVSAIDNLGLKSIRLTFSGGFIRTLDTTFTGQVLTYNIARTIDPDPGAGGNITIVGRATDGAGNFAEDTISIFLTNVEALTVTLVTPTSGALASQGRDIPVEVVASQNDGITKIGFLVSPRTSVSNPTTPPNDSVIFTAPLQDTQTFVDTLTVLAAGGTFTVRGFAEDAAGRRQRSDSVIVTIQSVFNDVTPPLVAHKIAERVEVDDTVTVRATDPSAISTIGFQVDTGGVVLKFYTEAAGGTLTDVTRKFDLGLGALLPPNVLPRSIVVRGYACDAAQPTPNCSYTNTTTLLPGAPAPTSTLARPQLAPAALIDTVIVVNGVTVALAGASSVQDAIYNGNRRELYLTNPAFNRVEVFDVASTSFVTGITTAGGQPWGIALWPRDTLGGYRDTIVVADAGGTQLSIVNVGAGGPRQILWRQDLPNFLIQTYRVTGGGSPSEKEEIQTHDLSDLPQYVATVCRPFLGGGPTCHSDSVFALYSTSPTQSSTSPFNGRGTLRMEKLIRTTDPNQMYGKFFWEVATTSFTTGKDTLRIELHRGRNFGKVVLSACAGVTVDLAAMGLGDRTFARNSGNFTHAFFGEGGNVAVAFARVMSYDARDSLKAGPSTFVSCPTSGIQTDAGENDIDFGMSPGSHVSDFISNTGIRVEGIATNFNGLTNAVRADSIYYLDRDLRRKATSAAPIGTPLTPGMDMNYAHAFAPSGECPPTSPACGGTGATADRIIFSARPDANIDVYDTYFGAFLATIPVRDPVTGPLRVARDNVTGEQLLFGVTTTGLLILRLPAFTNPLPAPPTSGNR
ncbi:MAG: YncE family protein [Gemmatimonadales bacterium]